MGHPVSMFVYYFGTELTTLSHVMTQKATLRIGRAESGSMESLRRHYQGNGRLTDGQVVEAAKGME